MKPITRNLLLALIFAFALGMRLYFAGQSATFAHESYFDYRQIASIRQTGFPVLSDSLSYGGREFLFLPAFHYLLAFFSLFIPFESVMRILPNIFSSSIVLVVYLLARQLTKNEYISLFTSLASAFIPIHFASNFNSISPLSLQIPLIFLAIYCFAMSKDSKFIILFAVLAFLLPLIHASAVFLIIAFLLYLALGKIAGYKIEKKQTELILFYVFIALWILLVFFKKAFLAHGFSIIWQNIPFVIRNQHFARTTIFETILSIGLLPIISGAYACYLYVLRIKDHLFYLLLSMAICVLVLIWSRLITPILGLSFLGIILVIFSGALLNIFIKYITKTKFAGLKIIFVSFFILIFMLNLLTLTLLFTANPVIVPESDFRAVRFLGKQALGTVLAPVELGHVITAVAGQPNVADTSFLLVENAAQRIDDIKTIYETPFQVKAITIMDKYDVRYLYVPQNKDIPYIEERCFSSIYDGSVRIYEVRCKAREVEKS
jgi:hypothetical protein